MQQFPVFYKEFPPSKLLAPYVKCYAILEHNLDEGIKLSDGLGPFGCPYLTIKYRGNVWSGMAPLDGQEYAENHVAGQMLQLFRFHHSGNSGMLAIVFQPTGLHKFLRLPMSEFTQNFLNLELCFGNEGNELLERITTSASVEEKVQHCEIFLSRWLKKSSLQMDVTDRAIELIRQDSSLQVDDLCKILNISSRHLRRKFHEKVGIGPKHYIRICRFHQAIRLRRSSYQLDLMDLSLRCGFYDQSHFCSEFRKFTGKTPFEYFIKNNPNLEVGGILR